MKPGIRPPQESLGPLDFPRLRALLHQRTGILLEEGQSSFVATRLSALAVQEGFDHLPQMLESLHTEEAWGPLHRRVFESLAVAETSFFRDLHPFESLRTTLIPRLIAARDSSRRLRIWCAACATGQEPYTVAIILRHHFPELLQWQVEILGTDFSTTALARAREGRFTQLEVNRGLPAAMLLRYFTKEGADWRVREDLRNQVTFREHNLVIDSAPAPAFDLILLRNVLLYFDAATRADVLRRAGRALHADGVLLLGAGETCDSREAELRAEEVDRTMVLRPRDPRLVAARGLS